MRFFPRISAGLGRFFKRAASVGAAWDGEWLSAARFRSGPGGPVLERILSLPLSREEDAAAARMRCREEGFAGLPVTAVFPQTLAVAKFLRLPGADPGELRAMAEFQALRQMPFSPEEVVTGYEVLETDGRSFSEVLLVVARREDVSRHLDMLGRAGLPPDRLVLGVRATLPLAARAGAQGETLVVLDVGRAATQVSFVRDGRLRSLRGVPAGAGGDIDALRSRVINELQLSLQAYGKENAAQGPVRILLSGAPRGSEAMREALSRAFPWPAAAWNPFPDATPAGPPETSLLSALAAALLPRGEGADLLPSEERRLRVRRRERRNMVRCGALLLVCLVLGGGLLRRRADLQRRRLEDILSRSRALEPDVKELRLIEDRIREVKSRKDRRGSLAHVLAGLNRHLPAKTSLSSLAYERGGRVLLRGAALSLAGAVDAARVLEGSGLFARVEMRSSNARSLHGREVVEFQLDCSIEGGP